MVLAFSFLAALSLAVLFYTWAGYPLLLTALARIKPVTLRKKNITPPVSVIIAARNEEANIRERIQNILSLQYPTQSLEVIVASDGSTDRTAEYVEDFSDPRVRFLDFTPAQGRAAVHNGAAAAAHGEILVFTDAETRFDREFLVKLVANFSDPRVGCVTGIIRWRNLRSSSISEHRGFYWRYEYLLRKLESRCGVMNHGSGPCMGVRKVLYKRLDDPAVDVDFMTPLDVVQAGFLIVQESEAICSEVLFAAAREELRAQARMVTRNLRGFWHRGFLVGSAGCWGCAWGLISHRVLRWLTPFVLMGLFVGTTGLVLTGQAFVFWLPQVGFYMSAFLAWRLVGAKRPASLWALPFTFCLANIGFFLGVVRFLRGEKIITY